MTTEERIDGPTPAGGTYAIMYFQDAKGEQCSKADAVRGELIEYGPNGDHLARTYADLK